MRQYSKEWWDSDEAYPDRCALYIETMIQNDARFRKVSAHVVSDAEPEFPAIRVCDISTGELMWYECPHLMWLKDWQKAHVGNNVKKLNAAALALLNNA